jgi:hypothetical protein
LPPWPATGTARCQQAGDSGTQYSLAGKCVKYHRTDNSSIILSLIYGWQAKEIPIAFSTHYL